MFETIQNYRKLIIAGQYAELLKFDRVWHSHRPKNDPAVGDDDLRDNVVVSSINRAKRSFKLLAYSNHLQHGQPTLFLTLTRRQLLDLSTSHLDFMNFVKRLNTAVTGTFEKDFDLQYLNVTEFQDRGSPHFHTLLFNFPFIKNNQKFLHSVWGADRLRIQPVKDLDSVISYVSKYMSKQFHDKRFIGKKRFTASRHLKRPVVIPGDTPERDAVIELIKRKLEYFKTSETDFDTDFIGHMQKTTYRNPFGNIILMPGVVDDIGDTLFSSNLDKDLIPF